MKRILFIFCFVTLLFSSDLYSQNKIKIGHIDSEELMKLMPGRDSVEAIMKQYAQTLESQLKTMQAELDDKYKDYQSKEKDYTDLIKQTKQKELTDLQSRIQDFQQTAQEDLQKKNQELLSPMIDKAKKAIEDVAKENGYTYIFDTTQSIQAVLYFDKGDDISYLVKKKLGIFSSSK